MLAVRPSVREDRTIRSSAERSPARCRISVASAAAVCGVAPGASWAWAGRWKVIAPPVARARGSQATVRDPGNTKSRGITPTTRARCGPICRFSPIAPDAVPNRAAARSSRRIATVEASAPATTARWSASSNARPAVGAAPMAPKVPGANSTAEMSRAWAPSPTTAVRADHAPTQASEVEDSASSATSVSLISEAAFESSLRSVSSPLSRSASTDSATIRSALRQDNGRPMVESQIAVTECPAAAATLSTSTAAAAFQRAAMRERRATARAFFQRRDGIGVLPWRLEGYGLPPTVRPAAPSDPGRSVGGWPVAAAEIRHSRGVRCRSRRRRRS